MNKFKYPTLRHSLLAFTLLMTMLPAFGAQSKSSGEKNDFAISLGNLCEYVGKIQTDGEGSKNICSFLPSLAVNYDYYFTNKFALSPQIGATIPKTGADETTKRMTMFALLNAKYKTRYITLIGGAGLYLTRIWGPGGEQDLNNGTGTDSFPLPKDPVYARNFIMNLGISADFTKEWSAELYTYVFNALKSEDRAFSVGLSASYHFGDIL